MGGPPVSDIYEGVTAIGTAFAAGVVFLAVASFFVWMSEPGP